MCIPFVVLGARQLIDIDVVFLDEAFDIAVEVLDLGSGELIVGFLALVFSQVTSIGINNYGAKKMLPRIIAAAILINLSFWVCAIGLDLSNILGGGAFNLIYDGAGSLSSAVAHSFPAGATSVLAVGGAAVVALSSGILAALVPIILTAALGIVAAVIVLVIRLGLLYLMIVISPLAFAAMVLPGTQKWFQRWREFFTSLLLFYPIIMAVFGAAFAAAALLGSSSVEADLHLGEGGKAVMAVFQIVLIGAPLFAMPALFKVSGGVLNRFAGIVNNPNRGLIDRSRKWSNDMRERSREAQAARGFGLGALQARRNQKRDLRATDRKARADTRAQRRVLGGGKFAQLDSAARAHDLESRALKGTADANWEDRVANDANLQFLQDRVIAAESKAQNAKRAQAQGYNTRVGANGALAAAAAGGTTTVEQVQSRAMAANAALDAKEIAEEIANAMKNLEVTLGTTNQQGFANTLADAIRRGDDVTARAATSLLVNGGRGGMDRLSSTLDDLEHSGELSEDMAGRFPHAWLPSTCRNWPRHHPRLRTGLLTGVNTAWIVCVRTARLTHRPLPPISAA